MATFSDKYRAQNLKIIPLHNPESDGTCSCGDKECKSVGKHPRINTWQKEATCDMDKIRRWKKKWPNMNVGIITGKESGIFVVDIDPRHDGGKSLEGFEREHGKLPPTLTVLTGGGGEHLYYKYPKDINISNRQEVLPGIDVRAEGGYIVAPPSIHASGKQYAFENTDFEYDKIVELNNKAFLALIIKSDKKNKGSYDNCKKKAKTKGKADVLEVIRNLDHYEPYIDQYQEAYVRILEGDDQVFRDICVRSKEMLLFIITTAYKKAKIALSKEQQEQIISSIEAEAFSIGETHVLYQRVAVHEGALYYNLENGSAVKTIPGTWDIIQKPPILFRNTSASEEQVTPVKGGDINDLFSFFNIQDENIKLLFIVWLVAGFVENIPHPILAFHGIQGTAKSTSSRFVSRIIDPVKITDLNLKDLVQASLVLDKVWLGVMDNISHLGQDESDWLCKVVTGGGFTRRMLYTNSDLMIRRLRRLIILNGIDLVAKRPDLLDRCFIIELDRIAPEKRLPENILTSNFEAKLPKILGACFDLLAKAFEIKSTINLPSYPRMADFAFWGAAILKAYRPDLSEENFCELYGQNVEAQESEAINSSPVAQCLIRYLSEKDTALIGTPTEVLKALKDAYPYTYKLPESVNSFGKKIKELIPSLEKIGIKVQNEKGVTRKYNISLLNNIAPYLSSESSYCPNPLPDFNPEEAF